MSNKYPCVYYRYIDSHIALEMWYMLLLTFIGGRLTTSGNGNFKLVVKTKTTGGASFRV